jgi:HEAT repeat protein
MRWLVACSVALVMISRSCGAPPEPSATVTELIQQLADPNPKVRWRAAGSLGRLGAASQAAVPALVRTMHHPDANVADRAATALAQIGTPALEALAKTLRDPSAAARARAARALARFGPEARAALPSLLIAAQENDETVSIAALLALGEMESEAQSAVPALTKLLRRGKPRVQEQVLRTLQRIGAAAVPTLVEIVRTETPEKSRVAALAALEYLGPDAKEALPALRETMKHKSAQLRAATAAALRGLGRDAQEATPELLHALNDREYIVQVQAANTLVRLGTLGVPGLLQKIREADQNMRWAVPVLLTQFGATPAANVEALTQELQSINPQQRALAILALTSLGDQARAAIPALQQSRRDPNPQVQRLATVALARLDRQGIGELDFSAEKLEEYLEKEQNLVDDIKDPKRQAAYARFLHSYMMAVIARVNVGVMDRQFELLPPSAVPALVGALNTAVRLRLGTC